MSRGGGCDPGALSHLEAARRHLSREAVALRSCRRGHAIHRGGGLQGGQLRLRQAGGGLMPRYVALFRGINVGKAKRIAMADLRALLVELGYSRVATLLNSGNVVFSGDGRTAAQHAER